MRRLFRLLLLCLMLYLMLAYGALPAVWRLFEHRHPALSTVASRTLTVDGIPGDPLNIAFVARRRNAASPAGCTLVARRPITTRSSCASRVTRLRTGPTERRQ